MSKQNDLTKTYSGLFGNTVVVNKGKRKSIITIPPTKPKLELTPIQVEVQNRMRLAVVHARNARLDPGLWAMYVAKSQKGLPAFQVAMRDFLRKPYINGIDASKYHGNDGDTISVTAHARRRKNRKS